MSYKHLSLMTAQQVEALQRVCRALKVDYERTDFWVRGEVLDVRGVVEPVVTALPGGRLGSFFRATPLLQIFAAGNVEVLGVPRPGPQLDVKGNQVAQYIPPVNLSQAVVWAQVGGPARG